jgi:2,4-dienoyl-CoA reductase-like NADH-dependent reductase (Old Yellow Enzyme family)
MYPPGHLKLSAMSEPFLFSPLKLRDVTLRNRIAVSPMCEYSSEDGFANDWHLVHLGSRAVGGAALVIAEATAVTPEGRISPSDLGIWKDEHVEMLARCVAFIKSQGAVAGIQLAHAGRKASTAVPWKGGKFVMPENGGWLPIYAPSAIPYYEGDPVPVALDKTGIDRIRNAFVDAARRALLAGFEVIEIHAAHGYLLHEFLSPLSNKRNDEYGGTFENRIRLLGEVISDIRKVWPETLPLFVRISATDWAEGGWDLEQSIELAKIIGPLGVDLIDCSSGALVSGVRIPIKPLYQTRFAEAIRKESGVKTGAVGLITTPREAEDIISNGLADIVLLAREMLRDPYFALHAAKALGADVRWPNQYLRAKD